MAMREATTDDAACSTLAFALDVNNNVVVAGPLDYETATSHDITVRVTDSSGAPYDETFTINVTDVICPPSGAHSNRWDDRELEPIHVEWERRPV